MIEREKILEVEVLIASDVPIKEDTLCIVKIMRGGDIPVISFFPILLKRAEIKQQERVI